MPFSVSGCGRPAWSALAGGLLSILISWWWLWLAIPAVGLSVVGLVDYLQPRHSIRRIYPVVGRLRWTAEATRPKVRQYFMESDTDGTPFSTEQRADVYIRAKGGAGTASFGTQLDAYAGIRVVSALDLPQAGSAGPASGADR